MKLRWYQHEAINAAIEFIFNPGNNNKHPILVEPTGSGKTPIICGICDEYLSRRPTSNILVLSHVKEILSQNHQTLTDYFDGFEVGLYSAGMRSKLVKKITVAGIQSVWRKPELFYDFDLVIIDECHLVTIKEEGMYRQFLAMIDAVYLGLTATPFRLGHGYITQGEGALFTDIVHDMSSKDNFNQLVREGYLAKLISKATDLQLDAAGVKTVAGDYSVKDLSEKFDIDEITETIVLEIIKYGKNYKKWLIFAIDIAHAEHIKECFAKYGFKIACVHSKMDDDRDKVIEDFKNGGVYRGVVNVDILTTGFDVRDIDLIAQLRHTKSHVIHIQSFGRGSRVVYANGFDLDTIEGRIDAIDASPKKHCLILDFAGNTEHLGPINDPYIKQKGDKKGEGGPIVKTCPDCGVYHHPTVKECDVCGHIFQFKVNLTTTASDAEVVASREVYVDWFDVASVAYSIHDGRGDKPDSFLVTYQCGIRRFKEWICFDHAGYAKYKADAWVRYRMKYFPKDVYDLIAHADELMKPKRIRVDCTEKYPRILESEF